jgi:transcriptional regulator with XRE-family HTH domain
MLGIGEAIRRERIKKGLTQEELSEKAAISSRFLQKIEAGTNAPSFLTLFKLAHALKTTPDIFLTPVWKDWLKSKK